jgi:hypothetical protein
MSGVVTGQQISELLLNSRNPKQSIALTTDPSRKS